MQQVHRTKGRRDRFVAVFQLPDQGGSRGNQRGRTADFPRSASKLAIENLAQEDVEKSSLTISCWDDRALVKGITSPFKLALPLILSVLLVGCESIGPTVAVGQPAGQSAQTFAVEQSACITQTDRQLQPGATQAGFGNLGAALAGNAAAGSQQVATNAQIQTQYNADYAQCMGTYGAVPTVGDDVGATTGISDTGQNWALFYVTPTFPPNQQAFQTALLDNIWSKEISSNALRGPNASPIHYGNWAGDNIGYELSVYDQTASGVCQTYGEVSACPAKLTTLNPGSESQPTEDAGTVCIFPKSGGVSNSSHGTRFRYDASKRTIVVETLLNGTPIPVCSRAIPVT